LIGSKPTLLQPARRRSGKCLDVQATLTTTESGEVAESTIDGLPTEPLVVQSTGGFSFTVPVYGQPLATRFTATTDGESLSAFIQNYDFDESGSVTVTVNSTAQQILSQTTTNLLTKVVAEQNVVTTGAATALADCLSAGPVEPCATLFASLSSATMLASQVQAQLALDAANRTPDPNSLRSSNPSSKCSRTYLPKG
jgi:hypothetical protein